MPIFNNTLLTEKGYEAANKAVNGQGSFVITRAVSSTKDYKGISDNALRQLTSLDNEIQGKLLEQDNVDSKVTKIKTGYDNEIVTGGYTANTVGLYAKDNRGQEFLYSVTTSQIGQVIPEQNNNVFSGFTLSIYVIVGNIQNMKVELSPDGDASIDYVNKVVSKAKDDINELLKLKMNRNFDGTVNDSANFINGLQKNGLDVASVQYVDDQTTRQFDNSVGIAKDYTDIYTFQIPPLDLAIGDSFDNHLGSFQKWNFNLNPTTQFHAGFGLPNKEFKGGFTNIPFRNTDIQTLVDGDGGAIYMRPAHAGWKRVGMPAKIALQTSLASGHSGPISNSFNACQAFFDPLNQQITLSGFIDCHDGDLYLAIDISNIKDMFNNIEIVSYNIGDNIVGNPHFYANRIDLFINLPGQRSLNADTINLKLS